RWVERGDPRPIWAVGRSRKNVPDRDGLVPICTANFLDRGRERLVAGACRQVFEIPSNEVPSALAIFARDLPSVERLLVSVPLRLARTRAASRDDDQERRFGCALRNQGRVPA